MCCEQWTKKEQKTSSLSSGVHLKPLLRHRRCSLKRCDQLMMKISLMYSFSSEILWTIVHSYRIPTDYQRISFIWRVGMRCCVDAPRSGAIKVSTLPTGVGFLYLPTWRAMAVLQRNAKYMYTPFIFHTCLWAGQMIGSRVDNQSYSPYKSWSPHSDNSATCLGVPESRQELETFLVLQTPFCVASLVVSFVINQQKLWNNGLKGKVAYSKFNETLRSYKLL